MSDAERIAEILGEFHARRARGESIDAGELLRAHPELQGALGARLEALDAMDRALDRGVQARAELPDTIGSYRILREIGRGGMGTVYEAEQTSMRRRVALKVLAPSVTASKRAVRRFQREARAAGRLHHTNIVPIHDLDEDRGVWHYAMELVPGRPLADVLADLGARHRPPTWDRFVEVTGIAPPGPGPSTPTPDGPNGGAGGPEWFRRIAAMFAEVADALQLAHDEGVVHRDIKPSNLLLDDDGRLKIVDFGLACLEGEASSLTRSGDLVGTPAYMSPEQATARQVQVDHRTDVYSLGATLYETLTLQPPFDGDTLQRLCAQIASTEPVRPQRLDGRVPRDLETIVLKAMEKERGARYQRAGDLAEDLTSFARGDAIRARRAGLAERCWRKVRRRPVRSALIAASLLLGLAAVVLGVHAGAQAELRRRADYDKLVLMAERALPQWSASRLGQSPCETAESTATAGQLLDAAIELVPERSEAWWLRAFLAGRSTEQKLADVDCAASRGLSARTSHLLRAHFLRLADEPEQARLAQQRAEECADEPTAMDTYLRARLSRDDGDPELTLRLLDEVVTASSPGSALRYLALRARGSQRAQTGDLRGALRDRQEMIALGDDRLAIRLAVASQWRSLGDDAAAERELAALLSTAQLADLEELHQCTHVLRDAADARGVRDVIAKAIELDPLNPHVACLSLALRQVDEPDRAREVLEHVVATEPSRWRAQLALGNLLADVFGENERALECFDRVLVENPSVLDSRINRALVLGDAGEFERALEAILDAFAHGADSARAHYLHGWILRKLDRSDEAIAALEKSLDRDPGDASANYWLGVQLADRGQHERALPHFEAALATSPDPAAAWAMRGVALRKLGRLDDALESFREAERHGEDSAWYHREFGVALHDTGEHDLAILELRKATALAPRGAKTHYCLAVVLGARGDREEAIRTYRKTLDLDPQHGAAWFNLGLLLLETGEDEEALRCFEHAVAPRSASLHVIRGRTLERLGRIEEAIESYQHALVEDATMVGALNDLGCVLLNRGQLEEAIELLGRAVDQDPDSAMARVNLCGALRRAGRLAEALEHGCRATELDPASAECKKQLAMVHLDLGIAHADTDELGEAIESYRAAIALWPDLVAAHNNLGNVLRYTGRLEEAAEHARRAVALDPQDAAARANLARTLRDSGELDEAIRCFRRAAELDPSNAKRQVDLGRTLLARGRLDEAIASFRAAIELQRDHAEAHCRLAWALRSGGDLREAVESMQRGHELGSRLPDWPYPSADWVEAFRLEQASVAELDAELAQCPSADRRRRTRIQRQRAWKLHALNRHAEALAAIEDVLARTEQSGEPPKPLDLRTRTRVLVRLERIDEALASAQQALELDPRDGLNHCVVAEVLHGGGDSREALPYLRRAVELDSKVAHVHQVLVEVLQSLGDDEAVRAENERWSAATGAEKGDG